jgi:hypothetical protein
MISLAGEEFSAFTYLEETISPLLLKDSFIGYSALG